ncbi:unnamed protein product, partial [Heterotrigona itama]
IRGFWVNIEIHFSWSPGLELERRCISSTAITASTIITEGFISASLEEKIDDLGGEQCHRRDRMSRELCEKVTNFLGERRKKKKKGNGLPR